MDAVEEIKSRLSIEDVVSQYVELKRAGRNWKALSPFSNERTASFMVSPEKQIWHDFSSGKGGDMFSFVMEMDGLDFRAALEQLARKAGVDLEQYRGRAAPGGKEKERLLQALELATKFYQLHFSKHQKIQDYVFKKRQFSKQTAHDWRLGYSPNTGSAVVDFLKSRGFSEGEVKGAGLSTQRARGLGDMFRGRLMIPLADPTGRVIGFTARLLEDDPNAPKYINTPQTLLYDKSRHVFGLHLAKDALRKTKYAVVAEGQLDVIASHQIGVSQVVATAGTALTEYQLKAIGRFTPDVRLSFDSDSAGLNATERAIPIAAKAGVSLSIITVPSGKDPDDLIKQDPDKWQEVIDKPAYAPDWLIERYKAQLDITSAQGKREFSDVVLRVVSGLDDRVEQEHYLGLVSQLIGTSLEALEAKLAQVTTAAQPRKKVTAAPNRSVVIDQDVIKTENHLLALVLFHFNLRKYAEPLTATMLIEEQAQQLTAFLQAEPDFTGDPTQAPALLPLVDYVKMLSLLYEELYQDLELSELRYEAARLQAHLIASYVKKQKGRIARELETASEARVAQLLEAAKRLDKLLKNYKGAK